MTSGDRRQATDDRDNSIGQRRQRHSQIVRNFGLSLAKQNHRRDSGPAFHGKVGLTDRRLRVVLDDHRVSVKDLSSGWKVLELRWVAAGASDECTDQQRQWGCRSLSVMGQQVQSTAKGALASRGWSSNSWMGAASSGIGSRRPFPAPSTFPCSTAATGAPAWLLFHIRGALLIPGMEAVKRTVIEGRAFGALSVCGT
ncbi:hypothetical protein NL676_018473 [Syzygium grande]|nr:hypothetical protein NL676_018473 [Syzygium grande]